VETVIVITMGKFSMVMEIMDKSPTAMAMGIMDKSSMDLVAVIIIISIIMALVILLATALVQVAPTTFAVLASIIDALIENMPVPCHLINAQEPLAMKVAEDSYGIMTIAPFANAMDFQAASLAILTKIAYPPMANVPIIYVVTLQYPKAYQKFAHLHTIARKLRIVSIKNVNTIPKIDVT